ADVVCGVRRGRHDPLSRRIASAVSNVARRSFLAPRLADLASPARVFRREALGRLEAMTPLFDGAHRWLPALFHLAGLRTVQRPISPHPRTAGRSKSTTRQRILPIVRELGLVLRLALRRSRPLRGGLGVLIGLLLVLPFFVGLGSWPLIEP